MPNPYEAGVLGAGAERLVDLMRPGGDPHAFEGYADNVQKALTPYNDGVITGPLLGLMENRLNYSFFFGRNIIPDYEKELAVEARTGTKYASRLGQLGQKLTGMDARNIDHIIYTTAADWGRLAMAASDIGRPDRVGDEALRVTSGVMTVPPATSARDVQWVQRKAKDLGDSQSPILDGLKSAMSLHGESQTAAERDQMAQQLRAEATKLRGFYERYSDTLLLAKRAANAIADPGKIEQTAKKLTDPGTLSRFTARHKAELDALPAAKADRRQLQQIRQQMNQVYADPELDDKAKTAEIDKLAADLKATAQRVLKSNVGG
jgi:hypothetical protein